MYLFGYQAQFKNIYPKSEFIEVWIPRLWASTTFHRTMSFMDGELSKGQIFDSLKATTTCHKEVGSTDTYAFRNTAEYYQHNQEITSDPSK